MKHHQPAHCSKFSQPNHHTATWVMSDEPARLPCRYHTCGMLDEQRCIKKARYPEIATIINNDSPSTSQTVSDWHSLALLNLSHQLHQVDWSTHDKIINHYQPSTVTNQQLATINHSSAILDPPSLSTIIKITHLKSPITSSTIN